MLMIDSIDIVKCDSLFNTFLEEEEEERGVGLYILLVLFNSCIQ